MILGARHIAEQWSGFELHKRTELVLAVLAAIAVTAFFVLVPMVIREITNFFRRVRKRVQW